jgi:glycosyltransferase involved in cell wall biosynthesis
VRIAQISPLFESVPPQGYGGTERVVSYLTEELVARGHEVTLFASGESVTSARLFPGAPRPLRLDSSCTDPIAHHLVMLEKAFEREHEFDVIHAHVDHIAYPFARRCGVPVLTTLHGRLDLESLQPLYHEYTDQWVASISDDQRTPLPHARWAGTVHHGLPENLYRFQPKRGDYLAFVGRISPEKRVDRAVEIARRTGQKLRIAAKIDPSDEAYYKDRIRPLLEHRNVEYVGEVDDAGKNDLIGNAAAVLFPIDWPEPFGLIMIEALACGTPVIAWPHGSVREVLRHGIDGFICDDVGAAVRAVHSIDRIDRAACRRSFEERFTAGRMAAGYLDLYAKLIAHVQDRMDARRARPFGTDVSDRMEAQRE